MADRDSRDEFKQEMRALIGPLLAGRNLSRGGSYIKACDEISEVLIPFVVDVRDGTLAEAAGVVEESRTLAEAKIRITHRRSNRHVNE